GAESANAEPLEREIGDQRLRLRVGEHAPNLLRVDFGVTEPALLHQPQQLLIGPAAPEEERQSPGELELVDRIHGSGLEPPGRTAGLSAVEKLRAHEYGHEPLLYPRLEPARFTSGTVEGEQRLEICFR